MTFGDNGVSCTLSKRLPDYVKTNVADFVEEVRTTPVAYIVSRLF